MSDLRVDWATFEAARFACQAWHYTGNVPPGASVRVGVWEDGRFIGVVNFSRGPSHALGAAYGLGVTEVCELSRVALADHESPVTQILKLAIQMLRQQSPGLRAIVSFADPAHGHVGRIYQAGNWLYLGRAAPSVTYIDAEGKRRHARNVSSSGYRSIFGEATLVEPKDTCMVVPLPGKFRYVMPLDKAMRRRLLPLAQPYPQSTLDEGSGRGATRQPAHQSESA